KGKIRRGLPYGGQNAPVRPRGVAPAHRGRRRRARRPRVDPPHCRSWRAVGPERGLLPVPDAREASPPGAEGAPNETRGKMAIPCLEQSPRPPPDRRRQGRQRDRGRAGAQPPSSTGSRNKRRSRSTPASALRVTRGDGVRSAEPQEPKRLAG